MGPFWIVGTASAAAENAEPCSRAADGFGSTQRWVAKAQVLVYYGMPSPSITLRGDAANSSSEPLAVP